MGMKKNVGFTCGAFDLCHAGHMLVFKEAKEHCQWLIVGLHSDPTLDRSNKNKPIMSMRERRIILEGIKYIDEIVEYDTEAALLQLLKKLKPDVRFLGDDWKNKPYTGHELNIPIVWNNRDHGFSTSELRERIYQAQKAKRKEP